MSPRPLQLLMGVVIPVGDRRVLAIPEGSNATVETGVFCAKYNVTETKDCDRIQERVRQRLNPEGFSRRILINFNVDAPDSRKLALIVREGEQHEVRQFVADFLENYKMLHENALNVLTSEVLKRLPAPALQIPVALNAQRKVQIRFAENENITAVVSGFINFFELDQVSFSSLFLLKFTLNMIFVWAPLERSFADYSYGEIRNGSRDVLSLMPRSVCF